MEKFRRAWNLQTFRDSFPTENSSTDMFDVTLSSGGSAIALAISFDENYLSENIIDG